MSKSTIRLEAIDPIEIYGAANKNLEALCSYFPELKAVARGAMMSLSTSSACANRTTPATSPPTVRGTNGGASNSAA